MELMVSDINPASSYAQVAETESNRQQTAKKAARILEDDGFKVPTKKQKRALLVAFAEQNMVIYGNAFDILKVAGKVDLDSTEEIKGKLGQITLYEIKSTNRKIKEDFSGYFFALTTAELLVAQNLKDQYRFAFVNVTTGKYVEMRLTEVFAKAKGIYPTWSIRF
jgi:hypothetical protein